MRKFFIAFHILIACLTKGFSQPSHTTSGIPQTDIWFKYVRDAFKSENAYRTVGFVEQRWRLAGNTGFNESIYYVEQQLKNAGFVKEVKDEADGPLTYRIEKRLMKKPTWEPIDAKLTIIGESQPLLQFRTNRNMLAINSVSTPTTGLTAELVYVGKATAADFDGKDVKGKIIFGESSTGTIYAAAIKYGAIGALSYNLPAYTNPEKNQNSIQFNSIPSSNQNLWVILLSYKAKEVLKAALQKKSVQLNVMIDARQYQADELTIVANARGTILPDERFVFSAHVQEPGANDNASGVGTLTEMARVTAQLVKSGKLVPERTLTFLWGDEIVSTRRYITDDSVRAKGIKWGMSLDMVGEDTKKTGGTS